MVTNRWRKLQLHACIFFLYCFSFETIIAICNIGQFTVVIFHPFPVLIYVDLRMSTWCCNGVPLIKIWCAARHDLNLLASSKRYIYIIVDSLTVMQYGYSCLVGCTLFLQQQALL